MLSPRGVPPRQEGGRLACDAEEEELEEGEARPDRDEDLFDPDVALSYIDEKLQHVLGHFQKDFERGVSADNLGPKFGGYGSFLPTYQHSPPLLPHTRSSHIVSNIITSRLPYQSSAERMDRNLSTVAVESTQNNCSMAPSTSDFCKKEICSNTNSDESVAGSDSLDISFNGTDSKSLKVQMKVGSKNLLPRKNAAVYSGLGLDISSSASMEESPDELGGLSPEFRNVLHESPQTIIQVMTCFQVPGGFMLSPLHGNILQLTSKVAPLLKKREAHLGMENVSSKEDETANALNALYVIKAPTVDVSSRGDTAGEDTATLSAQNINGQLEQSKKRKTAPTAGNGLIESSYHTPSETSLMCNQRNSNKQKRTTIDENNNFGVGSLSKYDVRPMIKSAELCELDSSQRAGNVEESQDAEKPILQGSLQGSSDSNNKDVAKSAQAQLSDITCLEGVSGNNLPKASLRRGFQDGTAGEGHLPSSDRKGPSQHTGSNVTAHHQGCGSSQKLGISFCVEEKSKPRIFNQNIQMPLTQDVHILRKLEVCSTSVKFDSSRMEALSRRSNVKNGVQHATVRQAGSKPSSASAIGKDGSMVSFALKEARDLKHKANHFKNKGLELESTSLYFEAALKFLHVAFLLETSNSDSSRPVDAAQSMKIYSETAKLCKFCGHEYERYKKMAAAALAYKCVEVAYLKAAYYKKPSSSKDRQELQEGVPLAPGESPSSFASDIGNRNSHGLSKVRSTKDGRSLRVAGNHLPLDVRNQAHLLQLLAYTNDINGAFDATRKSQVAIVSAVRSQKKNDLDDGLASVKTVLDFNFNNVSELVRLVRLSMKSMSI